MNEGLRRVYAGFLNLHRSNFTGTVATLSEALSIALEHQRRGDFSAAAAILLQVVQFDPQLPDAYHMLGVVALQSGRSPEALGLVRRAITLSRNQGHFFNTLGEVHRLLGNQQLAEAAFLHAVEIEPNLAAAYLNFGNNQKLRGDFRTAISALSRAIALDASLPGAATSLLRLGRDGCDHEEGLELLRHVLRYLPASPEELRNLATELLETGRAAEAMPLLRRSIALNPEQPDSYGDYGCALAMGGADAAAITQLQIALALRPIFPAALSNLGNLLKDRGRIDEAIWAYNRALVIDPNLPEVYNNLANAHKIQGRAVDSLPLYRRALNLRPTYSVARSNYLHSLHYQEGISLEALFAAHREHLLFDRPATLPEQTICVAASRVNSRLRIGFVSPDLGRHPIGYFLVRLLEGLDGKSIETICYSDRAHEDDLAARLRQAATAWRVSKGLGEQALFERIRSDRIDVLFDLAGHTANNRLTLFARRAAPVQISWAGYVGTTGVPAIDYLLADRYHVPEGAERFYSEKIIRMPHGYVCYDPPTYAPVVAPLPALRRSTFTFGCFNNPAKINRTVLETWAEILLQIPDSRIVLKYKGVDASLFISAATAVLKERELDPERIEFLGFSSHYETLKQYQEVDIALDTWPYSGGLTTCEALWMGIPVISFPGTTFASRHSLSHLTNVGLADWVVGSRDDYVGLAVKMSGQRPGLAELRTRLRDQMACSPLCDGELFARNFESVVRQACS